MPFTGPNAWRDAQTFGVARNLIEEEFNPLRPRYDLRGTGPGTLPGEFPLYNALTALCFWATGPSPLAARAVNLALGGLSSLLIFRILARLSGDRWAGLLGAALFWSNSVLATQAISIMPETCSNLLALASVYILSFPEPLSLSRGTLSLVALSLAVLVKPSAYPALGMILPMMLRSRPGRSRILWTGLLAGVPLLLLWIWAGHTLRVEYPVYPDAAHLTHHYDRTWQDIRRELSPDTFFYAAKKTWMHGFNIAGVLALLLASVRPASPTPLPFPKGIVLWILGCFGFLLLAGNIQHHQNYYASPIAIPCLLLTAWLLCASPRRLALAIIALQTLGGLYYCSRHFLIDRSEWADLRLERLADRISNRSDLFITQGGDVGDPTGLGRIGRRGISYPSLDRIIAASENPGYRFVYLYGAGEHLSRLTRLWGEPVLREGRHLFFRLRHDSGPPSR
jgi:hypothetical protein